MGKVINLFLEDFGLDLSKYIKKSPIMVGGCSYDRRSRLVTEEDCYEIDLMPLNVEKVRDDFFREGVAYLSDDIFYLYRGEGTASNAKNYNPGIYKEKDPKLSKKKKYFIVEPTTDAELQEYDAREKISSISLISLVDAANKTGDVLIQIPESTKAFLPEITENDDILKIIAKKALQLKKVDLDRYKDRFSNKNELFNFKQVLRSENKVSMKIFMRGMEALNLVFTIIVTEKSANNVVGEALTEPIVTSSEETYQMCA